MSEKYVKPKLLLFIILEIIITAVFYKILMSLDRTFTETYEKTAIFLICFVVFCYTLITVVILLNIMCRIHVLIYGVPPWDTKDICWVTVQEVNGITTINNVTVVRIGPKSSGQSQTSVPRTSGPKSTNSPVGNAQARNETRPTFDLISDIHMTSKGKSMSTTPHAEVDAICTNEENGAKCETAGEEAVLSQKEKYAATSSSVEVSSSSGKKTAEPKPAREKTDLVCEIQEARLVKGEGAACPVVKMEEKPISQ